MRIKIFLASALLMGQVALFSQPNPKLIPPPVASDFSGTLSFLSSDWMEGREAGTKGGFMAADYISSMMQLFGLKPCGDFVKTSVKDKKQQSYFQDFEILTYKTEKADLALIQRNAGSQSAIHFAKDIDFDVKSGPNGMEGESPLVFAGYGLSVPDKGYDDYRAIDVKGKIAVILSDLPGHADTTSLAWIKLSKTLPEDAGGIETKIQTARRHKAIALIVIARDGSIEPYRISQVNLEIGSHAMNSIKSEEPVYEDPDHCLPGDTAEFKIPCYSLGSYATSQLLAGSGVNLREFEKRSANLSVFPPMHFKDKVMKFSVSVKTESLRVRNVLGILTGTDTTKYLVVGGHYDHLGKRNGIIYNGSDDNASGASGMLALAKTWSANNIKPPCNIIFASWTAEEKGLLGSQNFAQHLDLLKKNVLLYINMDMISRSAPEDTARRIVSVGTRPLDEKLRDIARKSNSSLMHPFTLDLWDVTGHTGSDYASFTARNIPVMTFFSGFHDDYHTPHDVAPKADLVKMAGILKVVNGCIQDFMESEAGK
jgi:hypothetical protein